MMPLLWMVGGSFAAWLVATLAAPQTINPEAMFGMLGPLVSASLTWLVAARTYTSAPERLTGVMLIGFALKVVFFGGYVVAMLRAFELRPMVFVPTFVGFFVALLFVEAVFLKRLFDRGSRAVPHA